LLVGRSQPKGKVGPPHPIEMTRLAIEHRADRIDNP
jgi:hypothetical protein